MTFSKRLELTFHKWTHWEFYPAWLANIPVGIIMAWFAVRAMRVFFFSNVNPAIPLGGAAGESKMDILRLLPPEILPKTLFLEKENRLENLPEKLATAGIRFPLIAKPDIGERGFLVKICQSETDLIEHLRQFPIDFIVQELVELPEEFSVLFHHFPDGRFGITSICRKAMLAVVGDGRTAVRDLMLQQPRAAFQLTRFEKDFPEILEKIPADGERVVLERVGNHIRGTAFLNANDLISNELVENFRQHCLKVPTVRYGRFDLKTESDETLRRAEIRVVELNGVLGEPAHVYDPNFGFQRAYRDFYRHWKIIFELHLAQKRAGISPATFAEGIEILQKYFRYKKSLEQG